MGQEACWETPQEPGLPGETLSLSLKPRGWVLPQRCPAPGGLGGTGGAGVPGTGYWQIFMEVTASSAPCGIRQRPPGRDRPGRGRVALGARTFDRKENSGSRLRPWSCSAASSRAGPSDQGFRGRARRPSRIEPPWRLGPVCVQPRPQFSAALKLNTRGGGGVYTAQKPRRSQAGARFSALLFVAWGGEPGSETSRWGGFASVAGPLARHV